MIWLCEEASLAVESERERAVAIRLHAGGTAGGAGDPESLGHGGDATGAEISRQGEERYGAHRDEVHVDGARPVPARCRPLSDAAGRTAGAGRQPRRPAILARPLSQGDRRPARSLGTALPVPLSRAERR